VAVWERAERHPIGDDDGPDPVADY
jgi:hypothetical protein